MTASKPHRTGRPRQTVSGLAKASPSAADAKPEPEAPCHVCGGTGSFTLRTAIWNAATGRMEPAINGPFRCHAYRPKPAKPRKPS